MRARPCGRADRVVTLCPVGSKVGAVGGGLSFQGLCCSHSPVLPVQGGLFDLMGNVLYRNRQCSFISKEKPTRFNWLMQKKKRHFSSRSMKKSENGSGFRRTPGHLPSPFPRRLTCLYTGFTLRVRVVGRGLSASSSCVHPALGLGPTCLF